MVKSGECDVVITLTHLKLNSFHSYCKSKFRISKLLRDYVRKAEDFLTNDMTDIVSSRVLIKLIRNR